MIAGSIGLESFIFEGLGNQFNELTPSKPQFNHLPSQRSGDIPPPSPCQPSTNSSDFPPTPVCTHPFPPFLSLSLTHRQAGLERTFRLLQAISQVLIFFSPARILLFQILSYLAPDRHEKLVPLSISVLTSLRARFAIGRRYFRVSRFLESFAGAWKVWSEGATGWEGRLDVGAKSFNGMYLLLETATFLDALGVEGLSIWGAEVEKVLVVEAQRFWLFALVCGVGKGVVVLWKGRAGREEGRLKREKGKKGEKGKEEEEEVKRKVREWKVLRRMVADVLDLAVPGAVVGWIPASPGTVGVLMLGSTWITGLEVWEKCGDATKA
ncbi:peroxisomal biogenesis factor 11-domain-containing protein [Podospora aff. communis PSN243]|uniref:Peroxisomal biogenesis factor 11-domain-containing protein n=1 Tax=Podospora aff. communis PSN243 TaxID=3040156 RepID=A0AAV9H1P4_9PEZI|nr:peroxisomal biogenesis factor 11-domain-containing protein [Podospora aff. communis PSN243]